MCSEGRDAAQSAVIFASSETEEREHQGQDKNIEDKAVAGNSSDTTIRVQSLSKCYQIYDTPRDRLKQFVVPRVQYLLGRPPKQYFREFWALKDVSFEVKKGETVGIIGRNGSGKSTLLQLICGTLAPTSGSVETKGRIAALLELGSGFNPEFTGRENIYMNAAILGLNEAEIDARYDAIVSFADIDDFVNQPVKTYSSGMYVRLAFSVIAHVEADILVIDEALSVGDVFFVQKCMRFLREFMEHGTVIFVSHDSGAVLNLCDRAIWLHHGQNAMSGLPKEVSEAYLAATYEAKQGRSTNKLLTSSDLSGEKYFTKPGRDMRQQFINTSHYRNDIQLFEFRPDSSGFGIGGIVITEVHLNDIDGEKLAWVIGGEEVSLCIRCKVNIAIDKPIIGFSMKDHLGQILFGDNTYLSFLDEPLQAPAGAMLEACFHFVMPILPIGDYSVSVAVADGTQEEHIQHHWIHDALVVKSHASSIVSGLVGVPMSNMSLKIILDGKYQ
jgi:lipopolysaccharide transport system ATP-binding protein